MGKANKDDEEKEEFFWDWEYIEEIITPEPASQTPHPLLSVQCVQFHRVCDQADPN